MRGDCKKMTGADCSTVVARRDRETPGRIGLRVSVLDACPVLLMPWDVVIAERQNDVRLLTIKHQGENETRE